MPIHPAFWSTAFVAAAVLSPTTVDPSPPLRPVPLQAASCDRAGPTVQEAWDWFNRAGENWVFPYLGTEFIRRWQREAGETWADMGTRRLLPGAEMQGGNVMSRATRRWVSPPLSDKAHKIGPTTVRVRELDGRARTEVTVCSQGETGPMRVEGSFVFNDTRDQKDDGREVFEVTFDAGDRVVVVEVDGRSVGNTFQYVVEMN